MSKLIAGLALALVVTAGQAFAGDGHVSQSGLEAFGLGGMQVMSDSEGMAVRGQGSFAFVAGGSYSFLPGTGTVNVYLAGADKKAGRSSAEGGSGSASSIRGQLPNGMTFRASNGSIGSAYASAK